MSIFERLDTLERRYHDVSDRLADPAVLADREAYTRLTREYAQLEELVLCYQQHRALAGELDEAREMLRDADPEIRQLARDELPRLEQALEDTDARLRILLLPADPLDARNTLLEIRAGTGGDEAALFAGDLFEMYSRYAARQGWQVELMSASTGTAGGFKEVIALISGERVYSHLKFEAGTHRVQRVPATESQGRIHTSACTVAVLPEADEVDLDIDPGDLEIDTYRASGAGGQHVNTTDSAVRITHKPSGLVVTSQDERSQHKNKARALKVLRARLLEHELEKQHKERSDARRSMVGSGDRSERIRTYNFPQNRITDHRIGLTIHSLERIISTGDLDEILDALRAADQAERLARESMA